MKLNFTLKHTMIETLPLEKVSLLIKSILMFTDSTLLLFMEEEVVLMMVKVLLYAELNLRMQMDTGTY